MQKKIVWVTLLGIVLPAITGCANMPGAPTLSFWPFNKKSKVADTAAISGPPPAGAVDRSTATPNSPPTSGAAAEIAATVAPEAGATTTTASYSYPVTPAGYSGTGPAVSNGSPVDSSLSVPPATTPAGNGSAYERYEAPVGYESPAFQPSYTPTQLHD